MAIARAKRTQPKPKPRRQPKPDRPEHVLPAPYARLFRLGDGDYPEVYDSIASELKHKDTDAAARQLLRMIEDTSYYDYSDEDDDSESGDPRSWTRLHALCTFERLGEAALIGLEPLLSLLDDDDDYINEAAPFYYAAMGEPAIELLGTAVRDTEQDTYYRAGAGTALAEMGEAHSELRDRIVSILEQAVTVEQEDKTSVALLITNLLDLDSRESLGLIQQAFAENRVDLTVIQMPDVEEHFEMPVTSEYVDWTKLPEYSDGEDDEFSEPQDWSDEEALFAPEPEEPREVQTPYVAAEKVGRNEPCPCGSGKKYKKCCGA